MRYIAAALLATIFIVATVHASNENECKDSSSQYCRAQRVHADYAYQDKKLNTAYKALLLIIKNNADPVRLIMSAEKSQKNWLSFRDSSCDFVALFEEPGPMEGRSVSCLARMTAERTEQLVEYRKCLENDSDKCQYQP